MNGLPPDMKNVIFFNNPVVVVVQGQQEHMQKNMFKVPPIWLSVVGLWEGAGSTTTAVLYHTSSPPNSANSAETADAAPKAKARL